jgi:class I fructose-bisphosphate aldolase
MKTDKNIVELLGEKASFYLDHVCEKITKDELQTLGKDSLEKVFAIRNRIYRF